MALLTRRVLRFGFALALISLFALTLFAQTSTTGGIYGVVRDPSGAVVPNAKITVTGPNMIRPATTLSQTDGTYKVLNLPPGTYKLTVEAAGGGFAKYEQNNILVNLGRSNTADVQLTMTSSSTSVEVVASNVAPIDTESTTTGSNVSADQFLNFPTSRTVQGLYNIAPTVTRSGLRDASGRDRDPSVSGSSGPENNYILDGVSTADPAFGGGGANLPFEFVQEVEIKTGAYSAEYGKATGGIFNVITKSGSNNFHGDVFGYFTGQHMVRAVNNFAFTGSAANGFSEQDIGGDIGGPIMKNKLWFFGAFNPQRRHNYFLTQTFHQDVKNKVSTPFYAGKVTWALNDKHTLTTSTFGDFTTVDGFLANGALVNVAGFGSDPNAFNGKQQTGGHNYTVRLNSAFTPRFISEISMGLHFQRANTLPLAASAASPSIVDNFAVVAGGAAVPVTHTGTAASLPGGTNAGLIDYVDGRGGSLQRNFQVGPGFGLFTNSNRDRYETLAHLQNIFSKHSIKYGFEWSRNKYDNVQTSTGGAITYTNPLGVPTSDPALSDTSILTTQNQRITNSFSVCTTRGNQIVCPNTTATDLLSALPANQLPAGITSVAPCPLDPTTNKRVCPVITAAEAFGNPFLVRTSTRVRDFELNARTYTDVYSGYLEDNWKLLKNLQLNLGLRMDLQTGYNTDGTAYIKLNQLWHDLQPRIGAIWDFTGNGKGKLSVSYGRFVETPIPLDLNVRAGGGLSQQDRNFNVNTYGAPSGSTAATGFNLRNLGAEATPIDAGLRPQTLEEYRASVEFSPFTNWVLGMSGVYRNYVNIIEDGSFDDGDHYFLFNPGRRVTNDTTRPDATTEDKACIDFSNCFGPARRYYRAIDFTATKRFSNNFQFIASYTFSSLIGNYEGLFRNDNGQSDPNITSLFDLVSLLPGTYGRLPNDRPHQFKFNGSYRTPFKLMVSGNFYVQSGSPFNMLTPHAVYGNNEGFGFCGADNIINPSNPTPGACTPRGTAIVPTVTAAQAGFPNHVESIGTHRTPVTHNLDLGFYYPIKLSESKEIRLTADWFNVTNTQRAVTLDQTYALNSGVTGVPPVQNPFWGTALLVQPPSQWRFGAKFTF